MSIFILTISDRFHDDFDMFFTSLDKAQQFIFDNFEFDKPRKVSDSLFEGTNKQYVIDDTVVDQIKF